MILWTALACRSAPPLNSDSGLSEENVAEYVLPTLQLNTKQHHWVDDIVQIEASIIYEARPTIEPNWRYGWQCDNGVVSTESTLRFTPTTAGTVSCTLELNDNNSEITLDSTIFTYVHQPPDMAQWTVLVYLAADNNLEEAAIVDLNEMERVGSTSDVNIVVELDRSDRFYSGHENWSGARRYYVTRDESPDTETSLLNDIVSVELDRLGDVDTGDSNTLSDFIIWGMNKFPSENLAVVLWNHGWSWSLSPYSSSTTKGIMSDDSTDNDISIANGEFETLLSAAVSNRGVPIDLLGLDACIMQSWEVAVTAQPYANALIASQDYVSWDGWAYDKFLTELVATPSMSTLELADTIGYTFWKSGDSTISTVDLTHLPSFNEDLSALSQELLLQSSPSISPISIQTYSADGANGADHDLFSLLEHLSTNAEELEIELQSDELLRQRDLLIPHNYTGDWIDGAQGLSIYAPPIEEDIDESYVNAGWSITNLWDDVLLHDRALFEASVDTE